MFGQVAGAERNLTPLNQHVVTRVDHVGRVFWVLHTRAEDPVSVLIMAFNKDVQEKRITADYVLELISHIRSYKTFHTKEEYASISDTKVCAWGKGYSFDENGPTTELAKLGKLVAACKGSCVVAWEKQQ